jgi:hypothetical protein
MRTNRLFLILVLLTGLILLGGTEGASNLTLGKTVEGGTTYNGSENITWRIEVTTE